MGGFRSSCVLATCLVASSARARADGDEAALADDAPVEVHGFVSQGFLLSTGNDYLAHSKRGSFEFSEAGINVSKALGDRLRVGLQFFTRDLGPNGDYRAKLDWFFFDYLWKDELGVRAGRVKLPFGLYNDTVDIDAAHTFALLPQSVYPTDQRDFLLAQTGVELYGYRDLGAAGAVDYRAYGGTIFLEVADQPGSPVTVVELTIPYVVGGRVLWEPPVDRLRIGASAQVLRLDGDLLIPPGAAVSVTLPAILWVASLEYAPDQLLIAAEYSRWHVRLESSDPMLYPESRSTSERAYALVSYRLSPWLQPGAYYSIYYPDVADRSGRDAVQHDAAAAVRFDISTHWILKVEGHLLRGTADVDPTLNEGRPGAALATPWSLFLVKGTAYF